MAALTTTQISAVTTSGVAALTTAQVAGLTSVQLGAMSSEQLQTFGSAQLRALETQDLAAMTTQALVLDFGGVISRTLFETHALSEAALGLPPGTVQTMFEYIEIDEGRMVPDAK